MEVVKWIFDHPWVLVAVGIIALILWLDHEFKEARRDQIGADIKRYADEEHQHARPVYYPPNLRGRGGQVRAAADSSDGGFVSTATWHTWPFWATLLVVAIVALLAWGLMKILGLA